MQNPPLHLRVAMAYDLTFFLESDFHFSKMGVYVMVVLKGPVGGETSCSHD